MSGTMSLADLTATLKASIMSAADVLASAGDTVLEDCVLTCAGDLRRWKPNLALATVTLVAGQRAYTLPANMGDFRRDTWGQERLQPWEPGYAGRLPRSMIADVDGVRKLVLDPAPTQAHIDDAGSTFAFWHVIPHVVHANDGALTTIPLTLRGLVILGAQAEAMRRLAMRNITKPVQVTEGFTNTPRNGTASYLYETLLREFELKAAA